MSFPKAGLPPGWGGSSRGSSGVALPPVRPVAQIRVGMDGLKAREIIARVWILRQQGIKHFVG